MKKVDDELRNKIVQSAKDENFIFAEAFEIEEYEVECTRLLEIFEVKYDECFVSDISSIGDFNRCGEYAEGEDWETWMKATLWARFGIRAAYETTLVDACRSIRSKVGLVGTGLN